MPEPVADDTVSPVVVVGRGAFNMGPVAAGLSYDRIDVKYL